MPTTKSKTMHTRLTKRAVTDLLTGLDYRAWIHTDIDGTVVCAYGLSLSEGWGFAIADGTWMANHYGAARAEVMLHDEATGDDEPISVNTYRIEHWFSQLRDRYKPLRACERMMTIFDAQTATKPRVPDTYEDPTDE